VLPRHTILLQRLANPWLKPNPFTAPGVLQDPTMPANPYITIDYITDVITNDAVKYGPNPAAPVPLPQPRMEYTNHLNSRTAFGRKQPYESTITTTSATPTLAAPYFGVAQSGGGSPANTFFQHNTGAATPA